MIHHVNVQSRSQHGIHAGVGDLQLRPHLLRRILSIIHMCANNCSLDFCLFDCAQMHKRLSNIFQLSPGAWKPCWASMASADPPKAHRVSSPRQTQRARDFATPSVRPDPRRPAITPSPPFHLYVHLHLQSRRAFVCLPSWPTVSSSHQEQ